MRKIIISGFTGMLGVDLVRAFAVDKQYDVYGISRRYSTLLPHTHQFIVDFSAPESIANIQLQPDVVIHAAAITDLNLCERDPDLANRVHIQASEMLAKNLKPGDRFIYISTDSVFDGKKGNYSEIDTPNPLNTYAMTKWRGEQRVQKALPARTTIIRTNIYGVHTPPGKSFVEWAIGEWKYEKKISGFTDTIFNALYTSQLADIIKWLVDNKIDYPILNGGCRRAISKFDFLDKLRQALGVDGDLLQRSLSTEFKSTLERPRDTSLNTSALGELYEVPDFDDGINVLAAKIRNLGLLTS